MTFDRGGQHRWLKALKVLAMETALLLVQRQEAVAR